MSNLKTTVTLESTTLFPTPINISKIANEVISGNYSSFQTKVIPASATENLISINSASGDSGVIYLYVQADATNLDAVTLSMTNGTTGLTTIFAKVLPGDLVYLPVYAEDLNGITVSVKNHAIGKASAITYFYGSKD